MITESTALFCPGVVPVLVGPLQVILTVLPGILLGALGGIIGLLSPRGFMNALKLVWRQKIAAASLALFVVGTIYGCRIFLRDASAVDGNDAGKGGDWSTIRFDLGRTGAVPGTASPNVNKLVWSKFKEVPFLSSPAVVGKRVFITSAETADARGGVYCLDADSGALHWISVPTGPVFRPTFSSPVVAGDYLVCGEGLHETRDARVICLDVGPGKKGEVVWTFSTNNHVECTPVIAGGRVYVGAGDDGVYCLDLKPGEGGKAKVIWHLPNTDFRELTDRKPIKDGLKDPRFKVGASVVFRSELKDGGQVLTLFRPLEAGENASSLDMGMRSGKITKIDADANRVTVATPAGQEIELTASDFPDAETALAVHDGKVYVGLGIDPKGKALCQLDAATGKLLKRLPMPYPVFSPPTIADGKIFFGMGEGDYVKPGKVQGGAVRCLDLATLGTVWTFPLKDTVLGAVAFKEGNVYVGCKTGQILCLSARTGELLAEFDARSAITTAPAVTDSMVFAVTRNGMLVALDRNNLELIWDYRLGSQGYFFSSPAVAHGHVYVGTGGNGMFCVGVVDPSKIVPLWANPLGGPGKTGSDGQSSIPTNVTALWTFPAAESAGSQPSEVTAPIACLGEELYVPYRLGKRIGLACLPNTIVKDAKGNIITPRPRWDVPVNGMIVRSPVAVANVVVFLSAGPGQPAQLECVDRGSGSRFWTVPVDETTMLTATTGQILVQNEKDRLASFGLDGKRQWSCEVGVLNHAPAASATMIVAATAKSAPSLGLNEQPAVVALDRQTGILLWKLALPRPPTTTPVIEKSVFYLGNLASLDCRSLVDGRMVDGWKDPPGTTVDFALRNTDIVYVSTSDALLIVRRDTGEVKRRIANNQNDKPLPVQRDHQPLISRDSALVTYAYGLGLVDLYRPKKTWLSFWVGPDDLGAQPGPAILSGGRVFIGTRTRGLMCFGSEQ